VFFDLQRYTVARPRWQHSQKHTMAENKTKPTHASIEEYIDSRANDEQRLDCKALMAIMKRVTKQKPKMWGPSIVGYGSCHYVYESGRSGDMPLVGFAIRGREMVVYIHTDEKEQAALLAKLGKHKIGKSCLYFKRLADLDKTVLEKLIKNSVQEVIRRYRKSDK
jgi:hypothetical protein